ncbi:MAG: hypothetical protein NT004_10285 [Bacteroidetes bacterium]|nr:hypothetical protein [Bacteroidota bacterium]
MAYYNQNARFYTTPNLCHFSHDGIWNLKQVLFSKHRNLFETSAALIDKSIAGYTSRDFLLSSWRKLMTPFM